MSHLTTWPFKYHTYKISHSISMHIPRFTPNLLHDLHNELSSPTSYKRWQHKKRTRGTARKRVATTHLDTINHPSPAWQWRLCIVGRPLLPQQWQRWRLRQGNNNGGIHEWVETMAHCHQQLPICLHNNVDRSGAQEGSDNYALALLIFSCLCDDDGGGSSAEDSASALLVVPCSCDNNGGVSVDNNALALLIIPSSCKQEGGMMRGKQQPASASWEVVAWGELTRGGGSATRCNATTSRGINERWQRDKRQHEVEAVQQEVTQQSAGEKKRQMAGSM